MSLTSIQREEKRLLQELEMGNNSKDLTDFVSHVQLGSG